MNADFELSVFVLLASCLGGSLGSSTSQFIRKRWYAEIRARSYAVALVGGGVATLVVLILRSVLMISTSSIANTLGECLLGFVLGFAIALFFGVWAYRQV